MRALAWLGALIAALVFADRQLDRYELNVYRRDQDDDEGGGDDAPTPDGLRPWRDALDGGS